MIVLIDSCFERVGKPLFQLASAIPDSRGKTGSLDPPPLVRAPAIARQPALPRVPPAQRPRPRGSRLSESAREATAVMFSDVNPSRGCALPSVAAPAKRGLAALQRK